MVVLAAGVLSLVLFGIGSAHGAGRVLIAHLIVSLGHALVFTPLLTNALGSVEHRLVSHASAIVGTVQQVAGGAGTALMVSIMTTGSAAIRQDGGSAAQGTTAGTAQAFVLCPCLAAGGLVCALFLRRSPESTEDAAQHPTPAR